LKNQFFLDFFTFLQLSDTVDFLHLARLALTFF